MDPRLRTFLWILGSGGFFAGLGAVFGAITGVVTWSSGRAAGTTLGLTVARAFARVRDRDLPPATKGALVGGTDGFVFLGLVGMLAGTLAAWRHPAGWQTLWPLAVGTVLLVGGTLGFGALAHLFLRSGKGWVAGLTAGGIAGGLTGFALAGPAGLLPGVMAGAGLGIGVSSLTHRQS